MDRAQAHKLAESFVPPYEAVLSKPIEHSHCCAVIQNEDIYSTFVDRGLYDPIVNNLVDLKKIVLAVELAAKCDG